ncbi:MAG: GFA family protein [Thalassobaculum sp.]|uniref:GFA family protein n=1 Tax=Thalassobaculum sp. TaxID=2022740 RepID=UPI0032ED53DE
MHLEGSCRCGAVTFSCDAYAPVPYMRCYCSICRKTDGGGGYAVNLGAHADSLKVVGSEEVATFSAVIDGRPSPAERRFCRRCGSALWVWDPRWPELLHPFASAIDTPLPAPPQIVHIMLDDKPDWVRADIRAGDEAHPAYPSLSLRDWHAAHDLLS